MIKQILSLGFVLILLPCTSNAGVFTDLSIHSEVLKSDRSKVGLDSNTTTGYIWEF